MKKKLVLVLAGMLMLLGCGAQNSNEEASTKPLEIEYWHVASETFGGSTIRELVSDFNEKNPDIKVTEKFNPDMYKGLTQNLQVAMASRNTPAIVQMGYSYLNYANDNFKFFTPQEIVENHFPEDKDYFDDNFMDNILDLGRVGGDQVGIPYSISNPILFVNVDLLEEAGVDTENLPTNWDEIKEVAYQINDVTGNYGFFMQEYNDNWAQQAMMEGAGGQVLEEVNGEVRASFATEQSAKPYQLLADMVKDNVALHSSNDQAFQAFLNGRLGMVVTTVGQRANFESGSDFNLKAEKFPLFEDNERKVPAGGNLLMVLSEKDEEQKAAWRFMKHLYSAESLEQWSKGTGYLPPLVEENTSLSEFIEDNQIMSTAAAQLEDMVKWASFPGSNGLEAEQILINTRDIILASEKPAYEALKEAEEQINNIM